MNMSWEDIHGAGCQRSDLKDGDMTGATALDCGYYNANAPQGDATRPGNYVRLVRGGDGPLGADLGWDIEAPSADDTVTFSAGGFGGTSPYAFSWDLGGAADSGETVQAAFAAGIHSIALSVSDAAGLVSTVTRQLAVGGIFADDFESGDLSAWSLASR